MQILFAFLRFIKRSDCLIATLHHCGERLFEGSGVAKKRVMISYKAYKDRPSVEYTRMKKKKRKILTFNHAMAIVQQRMLSTHCKYLLRQASSFLHNKLQQEKQQKDQHIT